MLANLTIEPTKTAEVGQKRPGKKDRSIKGLKNFKAKRARMDEAGIPRKEKKEVMEFDDGQDEEEEPMAVDKEVKKENKG